MTKALKEAIAKVRELRRERQEYVAAVMETIAAQDESVRPTTREERRLMDEGLTTDIVSDREAEEFWNRREV